MSTELYFDLAAALTLAEHAVNAPEHVQSLSGAVHTRGVPALQWVADRCTYLISNGLPGLSAQGGATETNFVVFADGWGLTATAWNWPRPRSATTTSSSTSTSTTVCRPC